MIKIPEYMAMGSPIVSYDLAESRVSAGEAAALRAPGDLEGFARLHRRAAQTIRQLRARMGAAGRACESSRSSSWQHSEPRAARGLRARAARPQRARAGARPAAGRHSTVTVFARLRGWSTLSPRRRAIR